MSLVGLAMQSDNSGFDQFISRYAGANGDDPADAVVSDRLLNGDAFEVAAQTFMLAAGARAWEVYKRAEQEWRTPNRCVEAHGDVPARLIPGQGIKVHVSATSKRGDPPQNLRAYARFAPYRTDGLTVDPYAFVDADADVAATFTVTPPAQAWPDDNPHHLRVVFYSTGGIGAIDADLRPQSLPIHYRVLSASYSVQTKWSRSGGSCDAIGPVAGTITLAGNSDGVVQDITSPPIIGGNILEGASLGGPLQGGIWAKAKLTVTEGFTGCKTDYATQHLVPCSVDYPTTVLPGATTIGANVKVSNPASGEATFRVDGQRRGQRGSEGHQLQRDDLRPPAAREDRADGAARTTAVRRAADLHVRPDRAPG